MSNISLVVVRVEFVFAEHTLTEALKEVIVVATKLGVGVWFDWRGQGLGNRPKLGFAPDVSVLIPPGISLPRALQEVHEEQKHVNYRYDRYAKRPGLATIELADPKQ